MDANDWKIDLAKRLQLNDDINVSRSCYNFFKYLSERWHKHFAEISSFKLQNCDQASMSHFLWYGGDSFVNYSESIKSAYKSEDNVYKSVINSLGVIDTNTPLYLLERDGTYSVVNGDSLDAKLQSAYGRLSKERGIPVVD